jgi:lauroyl/myristoyl acyltransferase
LRQQYLLLEMDLSSVGGVEGVTLKERAEPVRTSRDGPVAVGWRRRGVPQAVALRAAAWITRRLPEPTRYWLADLGGNSAHLLLRRRAAVAAENYLAFTRGDRRAAVRLTRRAFANYARTVMDFLVLEDLLAAVVQADPPPATAPLRRAVALGQGAIVVTPHFGNWDLGAAVTATCGRQVHAVADQFGPPAVDELVRSMRERLGVRIISTGPTSAREALRALRRGDVLCLAADIDKSGGGALVQFLGRLVSMPAGPATLALRTGAALIPGYVRRVPGRGHEAVLWDPISVPGPGPLEARVQAMTQLMASSFESMIRLDPAQWFAFHHLVLGRPGPGGE